ncbi:MAG: cation:proton antiporter, partial [Bacillota bacterium]
ARSIGVYFSLLGSNLNLKEKLFCVLAYTPKATVQAAIGAVPLAAGVAEGELILALAVLSIIITAPLGAIAINKAGRSWLKNA